MNHEHNWVDVPVSLKGEVFGMEYQVSIKHCTICNLYDHTISLAGYSYEYFAMTAAPGVEGVIQNLAIKLYCSIFGENATATKFTPGGGSTSGGGVGRPKGYANDSGTPSVGSTGAFQVVAHPVYNTHSLSSSAFNSSWFSEGNCLDNDGKFYLRCLPNSIYVCNTVHDGKARYLNNFFYSYAFDAPVDGLYYCDSTVTFEHFWNHNNLGKPQSCSGSFSQKFTAGKNRRFNVACDVSLQAGEKYGNFQIPYSYTVKVHDIVLNVIPETVNITNYNSLTVNNNTWNGNIYVDNSNNLTYIYPQYTTINEKNETVTNISTNPIIYNNQEHKYYTYDTVTNNFYYISYGTSDPSATPTPKPTFKPGGGSSRGGGVGRHHGDDGTSDEDWYKSYYILNDYDYDCYYGNFYVDNGQGNTYGKSKTRVSTTAIPIADGTYKVTVPDDVNWRAWRWDADAKVAVPVNSDTWKSSMYYDFYASEDIIFEFRKIDGSQIKPKEIILRLDNPTIVEYEPGGKKHEYNPDPIYPDEQSYIIPQMNSNNFTDNHGTWIASGSTKYGSSYDYFMAFDRSSSTGWCMGEGSGGKGGRELPCYVQITIPDPQNYYINGYVMRGYKAEEYPDAWILQASTDGTDWEDLDTQTAQDLSDFKEHSYSLEVHKAYKYYRVKVTAYPNNYMGIGCFNLLGYNAEDVIIPTPTPSPEPTVTPSPAPTATPTPGGGTVPAPGGDSNISGGDGEGLFGWIWDLLKDIVKSILKAIFKIIANILGFLIWIVERVGLLLPFLPGPAVAALGAGVVLVFVIRIIRFIRG